MPLLVTSCPRIRGGRGPKFLLMEEPVHGRLVVDGYGVHWTGDKRHRQGLGQVLVQEQLSVQLPEEQEHVDYGYVIGQQRPCHDERRERVVRAQVQTQLQRQTRVVHDGLV